jgi:hypothetical protein
MSDSFNRRFALEMAVTLHSRNPAAINSDTRSAVTATADRFLDYLKKGEK